MEKIRLRIKIRWMMLLVAIFAITTEIHVCGGNHPICQSNAERCSLAEKAHLRMAEMHERVARLYRALATKPGESARYNNEQAALFARFEAVERGEAAKAAERRQSFRNASRFPWLAIPAAEGHTLGAGIIEREEALEK